MAWVVYMIRCGDGSLYTGITNNLPHRLSEHRAGRGAKYTRGRGFLTVAWSKKVPDKSAALKLEAKIKKMSKAEKESLVLSTNPLLERFQKCPIPVGPVMADSFDLKLAETIIKTRDRLVSKYSWAIPTEEALREIAKLSPLVEMGAGTGYWAMLLKKMGADVIPYDRSPPGSLKSLASACNPWHVGSKQHTKILHGTPKMLKVHSDRTLFLCWPPRGSMALECLKHWSGDNLVYVGEFGEQMADLKFHERLGLEFSLQHTVALPNWPGVHDAVTIWRRS